MTYGSIFSGVEGFGMGFDRKGFKCLWQCESDVYCKSVLRRHYPNAVLYGNVEDMDETDVPDVVLWSPPCQNLSVSGDRKGLKGEKSSLFFKGMSVVRRLFYIGTRYSVWENVPGIFTSNEGEDFRTVVECFARACSGNPVSIPRPAKFLNAGCVLGNGWSLAWRVLDAQHFGVPQRRKRIFLVADSRGEDAPKILFEPERGEVRAEACGEKEHGTGLGTFGAVVENRRRNFIAKTLTCKVTFEPDVETFIPMRDGVRILTPVERCRLMGWPDDWNEWGVDETGKRVEISDTQRFKQCGNGVVANVSEFIAERIAWSIRNS